MLELKYFSLLVAALHTSNILANADAAIEDVLVTGTYAPVEAILTTSSISVLEASTIRALNKRYLADVLKTVPGLLVEEQGGPGGLTAVSIRGGEANFTVVLVDGVPLNDPTNSRGGSFDFAKLEPASVERIEIVRGPQSAVYGSDALAGVINIITHQPQRGHRQQLRASKGEKGFHESRFAASGATEQLSYSVSLARRDDGEQIEGSTRESDFGNLSLQWQPTTNNLITGSYRHLEGERTSYPEESGGPEFAFADGLDASDYKDKTYALGWQGTLPGDWTSRLKAIRFEHDEFYSSPGIVPFFEVPPNSADTRFQRDQLQWVNTLTLEDAHRLSLGVDYRDEEGESQGFLDFGGVQVPTDFELDRSTVGIFASAHSRPLSGITIQGSLRYDDPDGFNSETSATLGASYQVIPTVSLSANWGEGFKLPSFFALGHALVGNPELNPETARSWDLGLYWSASDTVALDISYFSNDYEDLVDFDSELFINVNRSAVESRGAELQLRWTPLSTLQIQAQASHTELEVIDSTSVLTGRPEWKAGVFALWQLRKHWHTSFDYQWQDEQYASSLHTGESVTQTLDGYGRLDWSLRWQPTAALQFELGLDNLLDEDYQTAVGFPGPGRTARITFNFTPGQ